MATVKCPLGKRGTPSHEWHDGKKSRIYCQGWIDSMTDEYLDACKNCPDHVNKAQDDLDKWNAEHRNGQQLAVQKRLIYAEDLKNEVNADINRMYALRLDGAGPLVRFLDQIDQQPTIEARPVVHARFVDGACTNCGWFGDIVDTPHYNFCPGCGATTDLKEDDHEHPCLSGNPNV